MAIKGSAISAQFRLVVVERLDLGFLVLVSLAFSSSIRFSSSAAGSSLGSGSASSPRNALRSRGRDGIDNDQLHQAETRLIGIGAVR